MVMIDTLTDLSELRSVFDYSVLCAFDDCFIIHSYGYVRRKITNIKMGRV